MAMAFERAYWALAAQRNTRILGVFTRLWKRDNKPGYRRFQPRMWGLLERDLAQPHLEAGARLVRRQYRAGASARAVESRRHDTRGGRCACAPKSPAEVPPTAMIMAAGLGKRMRPLTATKPKPLIDVGGKALLDHVLEKLRTAGVRKVVVNVHYLADALEAHLATRAHGLEVVISDERGLLMETGGGLVKAEPLIDCDPFLALNSDNLWIDGPADTIKLLASQWDVRRWMRCCCWCRRRGR